MLPDPAGRGLGERMDDALSPEAADIGARRTHERVGTRKADGSAEKIQAGVGRNRECGIENPSCTVAAEQPRFTVVAGARGIEARGRNQRASARGCPVVPC